VTNITRHEYTAFTHH